MEVTAPSSVSQWLRMVIITGAKLGGVFSWSQGRTVQHAKSGDLIKVYFSTDAEPMIVAHILVREPKVDHED